MGYHEEDSRVRIDIFKPSGKWSQSLAIDMGTHYNSNDIHQSVLTLTELALGGPLSLNYYIVCLEPYHKFSHPVLIKGK